MPGIVERRSRIATARADFLRSGRAESTTVPGVVAASWQRSFSAGVDAATSQAAYHEDLDLTGRLMRSAAPVIARLSDDLSEMPLSIVLTDYRARILSRSETDRTIGTLLDKVSLAPGFNYAEGSVGTNGIGTVLESGQPLYIVGPEHFHEQLQPFACAGSPIRDPATGRVEGVLDISCLTEHSSPLMHSLVRSAAHDIERNLLVDRNECQQALFDTFIRLDSRTRGALMAIGGSIVMGNAVAQNLFEPSEQRTIHEHARYLMMGQSNPVDQIELSSGKVVHLRGTRIIVGHDVAGIVVAVQIVSETASLEHRASGRGYRAGETQPASLGAGPAVADLSVASGDGRSLLWHRACSGISDALRDDVALLVTGETGCGKRSLIADLYRSAVPGGRTMVFASADLDGPRIRDAERALADTVDPTLFLFTNIDRLSIDGVVVLNDFLVGLAASDRPIFIAATVSDADLGSGLPFRDLLPHFARAVTVAPLRHRIEDLPLLVAHVIANVTGGRRAAVSPAAMRVISRYPWPRNIRELEEALAVALLKRPVGEIQPEDLPGYCHSGASRLLSVLESGERDMIVAALHDAEGNRVRAAAALGIARSSLYRKLKSFGIDAA
ncbi:GAF domain-containing protein [Cryobacterium sp. Sr8]|uniref:sigma-54-dependent Fis family transcriptional regulator n=1 Tax=Cryobacterium sp. Sr8 TaxID=1259203 RepID=UPI00106A3BA6|nr:helix-turn-helix domain-containing protein [Cryobacterium sp. Sr8]TFD75259.1 GAF domain-containing protein [Cryobacterium sp. Sr8]